MPTSKELLESQNPYSLLDDGDKFAEHRKILEELSDADKKKLAIKIIEKCPQDNLSQYNLALKALGSGSFYEIISKAHQLKTNILRMLDYDNKTPHLFFLDDSNLDLINEYRTLTEKIISGNEVSIAERLALNTPHKDLSKVALQVSAAKTTLTSKVHTAFALKREIQKLLGEKPEEFFTSREFNPETCKMYSGLTAELRKNALDIAAKLSKVSGQIREKMMHNLNLLTTTGCDEVNPFKLIAKNMAAPKVSPGTSPDSFFAGATQKDIAPAAALKQYN